MSFPKNIWWFSSSLCARLPEGNPWAFRMSQQGGALFSRGLCQLWSSDPFGNPMFWWRFLPGETHPFLWWIFRCQPWPGLLQPIPSLEDLSTSPNLCTSSIHFNPHFGCFFNQDQKTHQVANNEYSYIHTQFIHVLFPQVGHSFLAQLVAPHSSHIRRNARWPSCPRSVAAPVSRRHSSPALEWLWRVFFCLAVCWLIWFIYD